MIEDVVGPGLTSDELKQLFALLRKCGTFKLNARVDKPEVRALLADVERWAPLPPSAEYSVLTDLEVPSPGVSVDEINGKIRLRFCLQVKGLTPVLHSWRHRYLECELYFSSVDSGVKD